VHASHWDCAITVSTNMAFTIKRALLNPKFDGYKLSPIPEADSVATTPLPGSGLSQSTVSANSHLFFQEVQDRIKHNHLAFSTDSTSSPSQATLAYIDKDGVFRSILVNKVRMNPYPSSSKFSLMLRLETIDYTRYSDPRPL
jgi:hypothetical protein